MTRFQYWAASSVLTLAFSVAMLFVVFGGAPVLALQFALLTGFVSVLQSVLLILAGIVLDLRERR